MASDWAGRAHPGVSRISPYEPGKPVEELERELGVVDAIKLASNENPWGSSPLALQAMQSAGSDASRYPDGSGYVLRRRLAAHLGVDDACITLGNGSNEVIDLVARAFLAPGRNAVVSEHCFVAYVLSTLASGAELKVAPARDYGHDPDAMLAAVDSETRVVFLANPNNPTGTWLRAADLVRLIDGVPRDVVVLLDQAYLEYFDDSDYLDGVALLATRPNLVVTRTFSKIYGLAALRVGYAASSPQIADLLNRVRMPFNVSTMAQVAATAALDDGTFVAESRARNLTGLAELRAGFERLGLGCIPGHGNFVTVHCRQSGAQLYQRLLREGVIVRPIGGYGLPEHLRVSVGTEAENRRALDAFARVL